jgi:hypothetical protein
MKRLLALTLAAAAISGCSTFKGSELPRIEPTRPQVYVTADNRLVVNQEPIVLPRTATEVTWQLPRDGRARFDRERGITVDKVDKLLQQDGNPVREMSPERTAAAIASRTEEVRKLTGRRGGPLFACRYLNEFEFSCSIPAGLPHALYAYTIRVTIDGKPFELDPRFMY